METNNPLDIREFISDSLNYDRNNIATNQSMIEYQDKLYVVWCEKTTTQYQIKMKSYDGNIFTEYPNLAVWTKDWSPVKPVICVYNNKLYISWNQYNGGCNQIKLTSYDGVNFINYPILNYVTTTTSINPNMCVYKDKLYIGWEELNGNCYRLRMKSYNGSTWTSYNVLNYDSSYSAYGINMSEYNDKLYIGWNEASTSGTNGVKNKGYRLRMKSYDEINFIEHPILNYDNSKDTSDINMCLYQDKLYITWIESNIIRMKSYNGIDFDVYDSLNYDNTKTASNPRMDEYNNKLYISWHENNGTIYQIKLKDYNATNFTEYPILNFNINGGAGNVGIAIYKNKLYLTWNESNQIILAKLNFEILKYLIEQDNKYYSIKPEYYIDNNFQSLNISNLTSDDFNVYGFNKVEELTTDININDDIFKPVNKFNKFKVYVYKKQLI